MTDNETLLTDNELVLYKNKDNSYKGGGYDVNSILLREGISPIITYNNDNQHGGGLANVNLVSKLFNNLAVPAGLLYLQQSVKSNNKLLISQNNSTINTNLYDNLISLMSSPNKKNKKNKKKTRKARKSLKYKTRKNRK